MEDDLSSLIFIIKFVSPNNTQEVCVLHLFQAFHLGKSSLPKTRSNLGIFQIALSPTTLFLEKLSSNLSRF